MSLTAFSIWRGFCMSGRKLSDRTAYLRLRGDKNLKNENIITKIFSSGHESRCCDFVCLSRARVFDKLSSRSLRTFYCNSVKILFNGRRNCQEQLSKSLCLWRLDYTPLPVLCGSTERSEVGNCQPCDLALCNISGFVKFTVYYMIPKNTFWNQLV